MGLEMLFQNAIFINCSHHFSAKLCEDIGCQHSGIQVITFLGNQPSFKNFVALKILTWESLGKL